MGPETQEQHIENMQTMVRAAIENGWSVVFKSPSGSLHDLSASNKDKLDQIEGEGLSVLSKD